MLDAARPGGGDYRQSDLMSELRPPPESPTAHVERFALRVPPVFGPRFFMSVSTAVILVIAVGARPLLAEGEIIRLIVLLGLAMVIPAALALTSSGRRRAPMSIEVLQDRIHLPGPDEGHQVVTFRALQGLLIQRRKFSGFFYLATEDREFTYPLYAFAKDEAERLMRAIRQRILEEGADGERRLALLDHYAIAADRAFSRTPVVTWAAVGVMASVHVFFVLTERLSGVLDVASMGAVSPELVDAAGPYLAFTAHWVHHGWRFQPLLVLPGIVILGSYVERLLGHGAAALSMLGAASIGGLVAAYYPGSPLHVGALIPAAGLLGTLAFTVQRYRHRMPIGFRLNSQWWLWLTILASIAVMMHGVSVPGVLFGILFGGAVAAFLIDRDPELPLVYSPRWTAVGALILLVMHIGAAAWAIEDLPGRRLELERVAIEHLHDTDLLNGYAWFMATSKLPVEKERLALALMASERSIGLERHPLKRQTWKDTKATVLHRLGRNNEAVVLQLSVVNENPRARIYASQLARFLYVRTGTVALESSISLDGIKIELETRTGQPEGYTVFVHLPEILKDSHVLYAPVETHEDGGYVAGLLRVPLPVGVLTSSAGVEIVGQNISLPKEPIPQVVYIVEGQASPKFWPFVSSLARVPLD